MMTVPVAYVGDYVATRYAGGRCLLIVGLLGQTGGLKDYVRAFRTGVDGRLEFAVYDWETHTRPPGHAELPTDRVSYYNVLLMEAIDRSPRVDVIVSLSGAPTMVAELPLWQRKERTDLVVYWPSGWPDWDDEGMVKLIRERRLSLCVGLPRWRADHRDTVREVRSRLADVSYRVEDNTLEQIRSDAWISVQMVDHSNVDTRLKSYRTRVREYKEMEGMHWRLRSPPARKGKGGERDQTSTLNRRD
ncbi:MAG: hypothetical protein HN742_18325 [Lentisphaerae bacterium]|jgi:hypothetical protein|nr:hypothetical protein [Lentisphaerota bacterium]MBT4819932.1 hypothetical protein [Lentisphaerota bacterium]MBT5606811.1 hypothetical protein [Lentisphaerota bacterium]MBT7061607.1 hypothetical protein [Lentisphaerota bacterium]MBT7843842.1 hypothetical protein [Lentisphaerota bacterium]